VTNTLGIRRNDERGGFITSDNFNRYRGFLPICGHARWFGILFVVAVFPGYNLIETLLHNQPPATGDEAGAREAFG
jgi:hypothetical protein